MMMPAGGFALTGSVSAYDYRSGSGAVITHHFCTTCGTGIFSKHSGFNDAVFLYASALDDPERFTPKMVIYTRSGPSWDYVNPALPAHESGFRKS